MLKNRVADEIARNVMRDVRLSSYVVHGVLVGSFRCYRMKLLASKNCSCGSSICFISFFLRTLAGGNLYVITLCLVPGGTVELGGSFFGCLWYFKSSVFQVYLFFPGTGRVLLPANIPLASALLQYTA